MNDEDQNRPPRADRYWLIVVQIGDWMFYGPLGFLLMLVVFSVQHETRFLTLMPLGWTAWYVLSAPAVLWLAGRDGMALKRGVSILALGAAPGVLTLPGLPTARTPLIWIALPLLLAWGAVGYYFVFHRLTASPRFSRWLLGAAGVACLGLSLAVARIVVAFLPSPADPMAQQLVAIAITVLLGALLVILVLSAVGFLRRIGRS